MGGQVPPHSLVLSSICQSGINLLGASRRQLRPTIPLQRHLLIHSRPPLSTLKKPKMSLLSSQPFFRRSLSVTPSRGLKSTDSGLPVARGLCLIRFARFSVRVAFARLVG